MEVHGGGSHSSTNMAAKGGRARGSNNNNTRGRGSGHDGFGCGQKVGHGGGRVQGGAPSDVVCQLCGSIKFVIDTSSFHTVLTESTWRIPNPSIKDMRRRRRMAKH
jgi:hypothetical protein